MKLNIYNKMLLRVPQFPLDAQLKYYWQDLKQSIKLASPDFYALIEGISADGIKTLSFPVKHSIWKYFNRAKFRSTPYGSFAGFGVLKNESSVRDHILIEAEQRLHRFLCWSKHPEFITASTIDNNTILFANSSNYNFQGAIRFLAKDADDFVINQVNASELILEILKDCTLPISIQELKEKSNWREEKNELIIQMIHAQLLMTDSSANIIGPDYFSRRGIGIKDNLPQYLISERQIISGFPNADLLKNFSPLINLMDTLLHSFKSPLLDRFKEQFGKRFDGQYIPLMKALDPEIGISITGNEEAGGENPLIAEWNTRKHAQKTKREKVLQTLLLKAVGNNGTAVLDLEMLHHDFEAGTGRLPNCIGALCSIVEDQVVVESIGGATAVSMMGRYSLASEEVTAICKELANAEQRANPEVLFFDIAYCAELQADNINRRSHIYPLQLSILNFDTSERPLLLDDIYVTVVDNEIMLISKRLNRRLIPRMSTAYNYNRSDLPLLKFLCELQFQGLKSNLGFNLSELLPGLDFYPRLQFRNIIMAPAKWRISYQVMIDHINKNPDNTIKSYLHELGVKRYALTRTDDRTMCFDTESDGDLNELTFVLKKFKTFYIEEGFVPKDSIVRDTEGKNYASQFSFALQHDENVYRPYTMSLPQDNTIQRTFVPGSCWVYYDIYIHPFNSDYLLQEKISAFLIKRRPLLKRWFFIRYNDGEYHIRLRMELKKMDSLGQVIVAMADMLEAELDNGLIKEFRISRYQRELERYGPELIRLTEDLFHQDSTYALVLISRISSERQKYKLCLEMLVRIRNAGAIERNAFDTLIKRTCEYFLIEHKITSEDYKKLNYEFKEFTTEPALSLTKSISRHLSNFTNSFMELLWKCPADRREKLFTDIVHMHINRLFMDAQRTHEMVIYYFLIKKLQYEQATLKTVQLTKSG